MTQSDKTKFVAQVGGHHYGTKYQHWDYCKDMDVGYFEGQASKYVYRWRDKNGIEDLKKGLSFIDKLMIDSRDRVRNDLVDYGKLGRFFLENEVGMRERVIIDEILNWRVYEDLVSARDYLASMIESEEKLVATAPMPTGEAESSYTNQG